MQDSIASKVRFNWCMKLCRFKELCYFFPKIVELPMEKDSDPWFAFSSAVKDFNDICNDLIQSSWIKVLDESISA